MAQKVVQVRVEDVLEVDAGTPILEDAAKVEWVVVKAADEVVVQEEKVKLEYRRIKMVKKKKPEDYTPEIMPGHDETEVEPDERIKVPPNLTGEEKKRLKFLTEKAKEYAPSRTPLPEEMLELGRLRAKANEDSSPA